MSDLILDAVSRHTSGRASGEPHGTGRYSTAVEGLDFYRSEVPTQPDHVVYHLSLCVVVQGGKRVVVGDAVLDYAPGQYLVAGLDLPLVSHITRATASEPYLALALALDPVLLADVARRAGVGHRATRRPEPGLIVEPLAGDAADALDRLVRLVDRPEAVAALYEPLVRELAYWLLVGPDGAAFARLAFPDGPARRVARAVDAMKEAFPGPVRVDDLAEAAGMSASAFNTAFKAVTALTPIQYYKRLRLLEARRRLAAGAPVAKEVAFEVGYESASQFSREYARTFGVSPARDGALARGARVLSVSDLS